MYPRIKNLILLIISVILLVSCSGLSEITVGDLQEVKIKGFEENALVVAVKVPIENPSAYKINVLNIDAKVFMDNQYLGKIKSSERVILPARSNAVYDMTFNIRIANFLGSAMKIMSLKSGDKIQMRLEGTVSARSLLIKRVIPIDESSEIVL